MLTLLIPLKITLADTPRIANGLVQYIGWESIFSIQWVNVIILAIIGWSGGAMVLGKLPVPGRPTIWITVGQGPTALAVGAGGGGLDIFTLIYPFSSFSLPLGDGPI